MERDERNGSRWSRRRNRRAPARAADRALQFVSDPCAAQVDDIHRQKDRHLNVPVVDVVIHINREIPTQQTSGL